MSASLKGDLVAPGRSFPLRYLLVSGQVALSLTLMIGAGLFVRTLVNLKEIDTGFQANRVLLVSFDPNLSRYSDQRARDFYARLMERVGTLPGVRTVSMADQPLLAGAMYEGVIVEGFAATSANGPAAAIKTVTPRFFETMGIPLRLGRDFSAGDTPEAPKVAIVNERFVRQFFAGQNPIGKHIGVGGKAANLEVAGVIADTKYRSLRGNSPATVYLPIDQYPTDSMARTLHVGATGDPENLSTLIERQARELDRNLPVSKVTTFAKIVERAISARETDCHALRFLRSAGDAARLHWPLWRNGIQRSTQDARNRHPHGVRRHGRRSDSDGDASLSGDGAGGRCGRDTGNTLAFEVSQELAVRRRTRRPGHACGYNIAVGSGGGARGILAGAPCGPNRSYYCPEIRVNPYGFR